MNLPVLSNDQIDEVVHLFAGFCEEHWKLKGLEGGDVDIQSIKIPHAKICGPLLVKWDWIDAQDMKTETEMFKDMRKKASEIFCSKWRSKQGKFSVEGRKATPSKKSSMDLLLVNIPTAQEHANACKKIEKEAVQKLFFTFPKHDAPPIPEFYVP